MDSVEGYQPGRSPDWLKFKNPEAPAGCAVRRKRTGVRDQRRGRRRLSKAPSQGRFGSRSRARKERPSRLGIVGACAVSLMSPLRSASSGLSWGGPNVAFLMGRRLNDRSKRIEARPRRESRRRGQVSLWHQCDNLILEQKNSTWRLPLQRHTKVSSPELIAKRLVR